VPKVSQQHLDARREQILMAAVVSYGRKGVQATRMQDIYDETGLSPGAVYRYFPSKQAILDAVFDKSLENNAALMANFQEADDPLEAIDGVAQAVFGMLDEPNMQVMQRASVSITAEALFEADLAGKMAGLQQDMATRLGELAARAQGAGLMSTEVDADYAGRVLLAIFEGFRLQKLLDPSVDTARFVEAMEQITFSKAGGSPDRER
jgi:AcrR family transcriptional regulator